MKKNLLAFKLWMVIVIFVLGQHLNAQNSLNIQTRAGSCSTLSIESISKIVFPSSGGYIITADNGSIHNNENLDLVRNMNFNSETTAVSKLEFENPHLLLYPNPVTNYLNIHLSEINSKFEIEILSIDAKVIKKLSTLNTNGIYKLNVSDLNKGIFLCKVYNGKYVQIAKFIKQ